MDASRQKYWDNGTRPPCMLCIFTSPHACLKKKHEK